MNNLRIKKHKNQTDLCVNKTHTTYQKVEKVFNSIKKSKKTAYTHKTLILQRRNQQNQTKNELG